MKVEPEISGDSLMRDKIINQIDGWIKEKELKIDSDVDEDYLKEFGRSLWKGNGVGVDFDALHDMRTPDWLDRSKLHDGQRFAQEFYVSVAGSELICLLFTLTAENTLRKLIWTGKSSDPYTSFKRYLSTGRRVRSWLDSDLFDPDSRGCRNLKTVNSLHRSFYKRFETVEPDDFMKQTDMDKTEPSICPFFSRDMMKVESPIDVKDLQLETIAMSQTEMTGTLFSFVGLLLLFPESFGVDPIKYRRGLEGFIHLWRYLGYRLGIKDEFNLCEGTLERVEAKCRLFLEVVMKPSMKTADSKWEHMSRSVVDGVRFYTDSFSYETHIMYGFDLLGIDYDNIYRHSSLASKIELQVFKFLNSYLLGVTYARKFLRNVLISKIEDTAKEIPSEDEFNKKMRNR